VVIYTKRGDKGKTLLLKKVGGQPVRVSKSDSIVSVIGVIDELNSFLGLVRAFLNNTNFGDEELKRIQINLLKIGSVLAGSKLKFEKRETVNLENLVDKMDSEISPLRNFIIPGGTKTASFLQYARALSRKAEREMVGLNAKKKIDPRILMYLNRLSDFLFTLSRWVNLKEGGKEVIWRPRNKK
jgi:cob(I)alamin adenosyltransferase